MRFSGWSFFFSLLFSFCLKKRGSSLACMHACMVMIPFERCAALSWACLEAVSLFVMVERGRCYLLALWIYYGLHIGSGRNTVMQFLDCNCKIFGNAERRSY
ncbi:hypothetical protein IWX50DRAFT_328362 [Phyllosticta citricarpa]